MKKYLRATLIGMLFLTTESLLSMSPNIPTPAQFDLVTTMGLWDQAFGILKSIEKEPNRLFIKKALLLGDDPDEYTCLHHAVATAPLAVVKQLIAHYKQCGINVEHLVIFKENYESDFVPTTVLNIAHESQRHDVVAFLESEIFKSLF